MRWSSTDHVQYWDVRRANTHLTRKVQRPGPCHYADLSGIAPSPGAGMNSGKDTGWNCRKGQGQDTVSAGELAAQISEARSNASNASGRHPPGNGGSRAGVTRSLTLVRPALRAMDGVARHR